MGNILKQVKIELGVLSNEIDSELYKLLVYEKGSFFKKHRDSEKTRGMFGTLVVNLPHLKIFFSLFIHNFSIFF